MNGYYGSGAIVPDSYVYKSGSYNFFDQILTVNYQKRLLPATVPAPHPVITNTFVISLKVLFSMIVDIEFFRYLSMIMDTVTFAIDLKAFLVCLV